MTHNASEIRTDESRVLGSPPLRFAVLAFGWLMFGIGIVSIPVPLFPSTVFLLAAVWAFSLSSPRFRAWIMKRRGAPNRRHTWHQRRAVLRAFVRYGMNLAIATMIASLAYVALVAVQSWLAPVIVAVVLIPVAWYILSRPNAKTD